MVILDRLAHLALAVMLEKTEQLELRARPVHRVLMVSAAHLVRPERAASK